MSLHTYRATLVKIIDGDTVDLDVDLGFRTWHRDRFRLAGINAPEARTPEGLAAADAAEEWFQWASGQPDPLLVGQPLYVQTLKGRQQDKYGRWLAWIYAVEPAWDAPTGQAQIERIGDDCLNVALVRAGHAAWYWPG